MDPVSHVIFGATFVRLDPGRLGRGGGAAAAVGALAPAPVLVLPNQRWSLDPVHEPLVTGRLFRVGAHPIQRILSSLACSSRS